MYFFFLYSLWSCNKLLLKNHTRILWTLGWFLDTLHVQYAHYYDTTARHYSQHTGSSRVTGVRNYTETQWKRDTTCPRNQSHPVRQGEFMRALTSGAQWLCSRAHRKPRTTIFLELRAAFLAAANRLFHVDWLLAVWNKNWRLSKTDCLLTPWKYGTD